MTEIAYVGLDHHHAAPYLRTLRELPAEVTCGCRPTGDPDPDAEAELGDVPVYDDVERALEAEPDALWLTVPNRAVPGIVDDALARDVDVFTEKPAGRTAADLAALRERADESDAIVTPAYVWRSHPAPGELRERARAGFFGETRAIEARFVASAIAHRDADHYLYDATASRGGIVQWLGVHWIDLLPWILDDPIVAVSASLQYGTDTVDVEDGATVQFRTASGTIGSLRCGYSLRDGVYDTDVRIYGDRGRIAWQPRSGDFGSGRASGLVLDGNDWDGPPQRTITYGGDDTPGYAGGFGLAFVRQFLAARTGEADPPATLEDAIGVLAVLDAVYESAEVDGWVEVDRSPA